MFQNSLSVAMMEKSASALWRRQQVILHNVANEDTPGYKAKRLEFESALRRELHAGTPRVSAISGSALQRVERQAPIVYEDNSTIGRADGNNVNILNEQIEMARTQIQYNALLQRISGHYATLKYVISGGR